MVINEQKEPMEPWETHQLFEQADISVPPYVIYVYLFLYLAQCSPFEEKMKVSR